MKHPRESRRPSLGPMADTQDLAGDNRKARRYLKRLRRRARRRWERADPEGAHALEGRYDGWYS